MDKVKETQHSQDKKIKVLQNSINFNLEYKNLSKKKINYFRKNIEKEFITANSKNLCGELNYKKYGVKNNNPLKRLTELYCDGFLLSVRMHPKDCNKPGMVGLGNKHIRNFVKDMELETHDVKIRRCKEVVNKESLVLGRNGLQKSYRHVVYKVGCADIPITKIIKVLEKKDLRNSKGIYLEDVDFTTDYSGSFNKEEIIDHLLSIGYKLQNSVETTMDESIGTIAYNNYAVGRNCVSFLQSIGGCTIRSKIYDKMVQMLESKGVQDFIGNHWKNWIMQKDTRLASSRDASKDRGLTRLETTLY